MLIETAGYLSGIAILLSFAPYIKDIFLGKTKPERASWLIWSILGFISFFSQLAKGAEYSLILTGAQAVGDLLIFLLSIKHGIGGWHKRDQFALAGVVVSLFLWNLTNEAAVALFLAILIDATGVVLTMIKSYERPETETASAWLLTLAGGFFGLIAVGNFNPTLLAFPIYICLASLGILAAMKLGQAKKLAVQN